MPPIKETRAQVCGDFARQQFPCPPDEASPGFRPLAWNGRVNSEDDVRDLLRHIDLSPESLDSGPFVDMASAQSALQFQGLVLNTILAWSNATTDVWFLSQRLPDQKWRTYGIAQDKTVVPNMAFYFQLTPGPMRFRGQSCFVCHASGPRALRPIGNLLAGAGAALAFNHAIEDNGSVSMHFGADEPAQPLGPALNVRACTECHNDRSTDRARLYRVHQGSVAALFESGAMPADYGPPSLWQELELNAWLAEGAFDRTVEQGAALLSTYRRKH
jgi:hypothetical protein